MGAEDRIRTGLNAVADLPAKEDDRYRARPVANRERTVPHRTQRRKDLVFVPRFNGFTVYHAVAVVHLVFHDYSCLSKAKAGRGLEAASSNWMKYVEGPILW
jgi:hypothetical protein